MLITATPILRFGCVRLSYMLPKTPVQEKNHREIMEQYGKKVVVPREVGIGADLLLEDIVQASVGNQEDEAPPGQNLYVAHTVPVFNAVYAFNMKLRLFLLKSCRLRTPIAS